MMKNVALTSLRTALYFVVVALLIKVAVSVVLNYRNYFPPNFNSEFLQGRESYFFGSYQWVFYPHIVSGPIALSLGTVLTCDPFRIRFPQWHRCLGRIQVICVLFLVVPSGLWMSYRSQSGPIAGIGFAALAIATGINVFIGWRCALLRRF